MPIIIFQYSLLFTFSNMLASMVLAVITAIFTHISHIALSLRRYPIFLIHGIQTESITYMISKDKLASCIIVFHYSVRTLI